MLDVDEGYPTPEEAALAEWPPSSAAHVVRTSIAGDRAEVLIDFETSHPYYVYCVRRNGTWHEGPSGNAPTADWQDPDLYGW